MNPSDSLRLPEAELYEIYRKYIQHQDDVVNKRLDRLFAVHTALVLLAGFTVTKGPFANLPGPVLFFFSLFGLLFCHVQRSAIKAGLDATRALVRQWNSLVTKEQMDSFGLPGIVGGGDLECAITGRIMTLRAPWLLALLWGAICCTAILICVHQRALIRTYPSSYLLATAVCICLLVLVGARLRRWDNLDARRAFVDHVE